MEPIRFEKGFWYEYTSSRAGDGYFTQGKCYRYAGRNEAEDYIMFIDNHGDEHKWTYAIADTEFGDTGFSHPDMKLIVEPALGAKYDGGKLLWRPLMNGLAAALKVVSAVLTYGARKYAEDSWQEVPNGKVRYENALYRHQNDRALEDFDKESGLLHSAHIATNALFILWFEILEHLNKGKTLESLTTFNDPTSAKH